MKTTLRNVYVELWLKVGLGTIILILRPKSRVCNGSTVAQTLQKLQEFLQQGRWWPLPFGIVSALHMVDYLEKGRTITSEYYGKEPRLLRQEIVKKRREKFPRGVLLLQDNAPAHTSRVAMAAATKCSFEVIPHPSYFPDLGPSDFCLFPNLKTNLCGTWQAQI